MFFHFCFFFLSFDPCLLYISLGALQTCLVSMFDLRVSFKFICAYNYQVMNVETIEQ